MTLRTALFAATVLGLGAMSGLSVSASAATMNIANPAISGANSGDAAVTKVDMRRWDPRRDGDRQRMRGGKYRYFHGGYYYATPWWQVGVPLAPGLVVGVPTPWTPDGSAIANANMGTSIARAVVIIAAVVGLSAADVQRT